MPTPEILQPFQTLLKQFDQLLATTFDRPIELDSIAVETAINEAPHELNEKALMSFGYYLLNLTESRAEPEFWQVYYKSRKVGAATPHWDYALGIALEDMQETVEDEKILAFFRGAK